ncbi:MAG: hypothetical protein NVS4B6_24050 [Mycobacterium sp.]
MAVIMQQVMPAGIPLDMLDAVTEEMGADTSPPEGMLLHAHYEQDGSVHILDLWESAEAFQAFRDSRLMPAMATVAEARGFDLAAAGPPETVFTEVHRLVRGK